MSETELNEGHPLFKILQSGLYHCTNIDSFKKIRLSNSLKPNDGGFPDTWGKHNSMDNPCRCREIGALSFLDFESASLKEIFEQPNPSKWMTCFSVHKPVCVILGVQRESLKSKLISYQEARFSNGNKNSMIIPFVECCYPAEIPLNLVVKIILLCSHDFNSFEVFDSHIPNDEEISNVISRFPKQVAQPNLVAELMRNPNIQARFKRAKEMASQLLNK